MFATKRKQNARKTMTEQLDAVRVRIDETEHLASTYRNKLRAADALNATIVEGYVNNIDIIVDISNLLNEYKRMMTQVVDQLGSLQGRESDANVKSIEDLTKQKMDKVASFFDEDVKEIKGLLAMFGKHRSAEKLVDSEANFKRIQGMHAQRAHAQRR
jgi:hypothetical protein